METERIAEQNPWWKNTAWAEEDRDLRRLKNYAFVFERKQFIPLKKGVTIVYGPRQVGKTTWIKKTIQEKLGQANPNIFFERRNRSGPVRIIGNNQNRSWPIQPPIRFY